MRASESLICLRRDSKSLSAGVGAECQDTPDLATCSARQTDGVHDGFNMRVSTLTTVTNEIDRSYV